MYNHNQQRKGLETVSRKKFMYLLSEQLIKPWLEQRKIWPTLTRSLICSTIENILNQDESQERATPILNKCAITPSSLLCVLQFKNVNFLVTINVCIYKYPYCE
nr:unnamed protein product [Callosobruchus analis]